MMKSSSKKEFGAALAYLYTLLLLCSSFGSQVTKAQGIMAEMAEMADYPSTGKYSHHAYCFDSTAANNAQIWGLQTPLSTYARAGWLETSKRVSCQD
jgi:hypothetical protein